MSRVCETCGKGSQKSATRSHSNIKTRTRWLPNLKKVKHFVNGATTTVYSCTRCIKTGLVVKPPVRTWKAGTAEARPNA